MSQLQDWYLANMGVVKYTLRESWPDVSDAVETSVDKLQQGASARTTRSEGEAIIDAIKAQSSGTIETKAEKKTQERKVEKEAKEKQRDVSSEKNLDDSSVQKEALSESALPEEISPEETAPEKTVSFNLACWHPVDDLLVINDLGDAANPSGDEQQLISNILFAIDRRSGDAIQLQPEVLSWPGKSPEKSEAAARTMLTMFLSSRIKTRGVCWVFLMGLSARQYIDEISGLTTGDSIQLSGGATALLLPSLSELLENPSLKRVVWSSIQHLASNSQQ